MSVDLRTPQPTAAARIDPGYLDELRGRVRLSELTGRSVALKRRGGALWGLCPFHAEKTPSFMVDDTRRRWRCWGCRTHGDAIDFVMRAEGLGFADAVEALAAQVGLGAVTRSPSPAVSRPQPKKVSHDEFDADARKRQAAALAIWCESRSAAGTAVETYLRRRGITLPVPPALRFHPGLKHGPTSMALPAMVAAVRTPDGAITAMHRTWLRPDGSGKAEIESSKMALGRLGRGAVRLGPDAPTMGIAEGIETALSTQEIFRIPTWAALGCRLDKIELPFAAAHLIVFRDNGEAGERAAERVREAQRNQGRRITIKAPPESFKDWNDALCARRWAA